MNDRKALVTDMDRYRLGMLLTTRNAKAWGERRWRAELEEELDNADVVGSDCAPETLVTMNTTCLLENLRSGKTHTATLVYPEDMDLVTDGISVFEPLGTALLGCQVDDVVECPDTECRQRWRVAEIVYQPEHAGVRHL